MGVSDSGLTGKVRTPPSSGNLNTLRQQIHTAHTMSSRAMSPGPHSVNDQADSSDSDGEPAVKKLKRNPKKKWTDEKKAALKPLVLKAFRKKKPPTKSDITRLLKTVL
ncbi:hypothetical protein DPMN_112385 [Dreissena polymorpha]|uniref:Uncharacterized protein n=1 Tax=Dreissena polymorpha TaxID=45954 RepID=A0A9D4QQL2_DREPO|nr:hypothetical protein DPMN_112385 [Dreissena polymorpha]